MKSLQKTMGLLSMAVTIAVIRLTGFHSRFWYTKENRKVPKGSMMRTTGHDGADVLILSYKRSGSTFLGRLLGWRNDSFYWYEPLWKPHPDSFFRADGRLCRYTSPHCVENETFEKSSLHSALGFLKDFYPCELKGHHQFFQTKAYESYSRTGPGWNSFRHCRKHKNTVTKCLSETESLCRTATHRVAKVLRLDVLYANNLLQLFPRLQVVFLLRDPRGILNSHLHTPWFRRTLKLLKEFGDDAKVVCSRMERDLQAANLLIQLFQDRVKVIQYEDLVSSPEKANLLYRNLGMRMLARGLDDLYKFNTTPGEPFDPFSYRKEMSWDVLKVIDTYCSRLYVKLGFVKFKDLKHLRNLTSPTIIDKLPFALS